MELASSERIKKHVIRVLKANRDAFLDVVSTNASRQRRIFDSDEEIDNFVKGQDLLFAETIAKTKNHPAQQLYKIFFVVAHGDQIPAYNGIFLKAVLNATGGKIEGLMINSANITDVEARDQVLEAREFPTRFGGKDAVTDIFALDSNFLYLADDRTANADIYVTDVERSNSAELKSPEFCENGIIAGCIEQAMRDGLEMDVVKAFSQFKQNALQSIINGATILGNLPQ